MEELYFNSNRISHVMLLYYLNSEQIRVQDDSVVVKYGKSTQHIFKNGHYMITVDWSKV